MTAYIETASYRVDFLGPWTAAALTVRFDLTPFAPPADRAELIEQLFASEQAAAAQRGHSLFNGKLARLAGAAGDARQLTLTLQPTDFKTYLASNLLAPERFGDDQRADPVGVSAIVRSADGKLLLGRRSEKVAYNRDKLHTFGGVTDWSRPSAGDSADGGWLFDQLLKELFEELNLQPEELTAVTALALARDKRIRQPEVLCLARTALPADVMVRRWREEGNSEHVELWQCDDSPLAVGEHLARQPAAFSPITVAGLLAHLAIRFGPDALAGVGAG